MSWVSCVYRVCIVRVSCVCLLCGEETIEKHRDRGELVCRSNAFSLFVCKSTTLLNASALSLRTTVLELAALLY